MHYKAFALVFVAAAFAQDQAADFSQVVSVLVTALPSSLIQEYATNSAAVASEISSEFKAGNTPSWFAALPTNVQTYLVPAAEILTSANATIVSSSVSGAPTVFSNTGNSTLATTRRTPSTTNTASSSGGQTTGSSSGGSGSSSDSSSSTSSGGASLPTAVMGMGLAGAAGLVGLLAL